MTDRRFSYDERLLECCARSSLGMYVAETMHGTGSTRPRPLEPDVHPIEDSVPDEGSQCCVTLLTLHALHYGRQHGPLESLIQPIPTEATDPSAIYRLGHKMRALVANVVLIDRHNSAAAVAMDDVALSRTAQHRLGLNRFSDQPISVDDSDSTEIPSRRQRRLLRNEQGNNINHNNRDNESSALPTPFPLSSTEEIMLAASRFGLGSTVHRQYRYKKQQPSNRISFDQYPKPMRLPTGDESEIPFRTPTMASGMDGTLVSIKRQKRHEKRPSDDDWIDTSESSEPLLNHQPTTDAFATAINWATTDNPDGVAIVHEAMDQGTCGSCWASSAAASVAASAARRQAYQAYAEYFGNNVTISSNLTQHATDYAQHVERATVQRVDLSIQELLDCDTEVDLGCTGGNPLLAFNFIHKYGLVGADRYPYVGVPQTCNTKLTNDPVASVEAWGVLPSDSETHMELAIRHIGPISVGINGADPSFLSYDGGIFSKENCKQGANHALLIVGYGEEQSVEWDGNTTITTRYWIARNSWGRGWGENGFVRIKRHNGLKGTPGECGIARSPSVALGGVLLQAIDTESIGLDNPNDSHLQHLERSTVPLDPPCYFGRWPHGTCVSNAWLLGLIALVAALIVVWPLSHDYRQRSRRRREARLQAEELTTPPEAHGLTSNASTAHSYGSTNGN